MSDNMYSDIQGRGNPDNLNDEIAVKSFFLYMNRFLIDKGSFNLPPFFIEARKKFTFDEVDDMLNELYYEK